MGVFAFFSYSARSVELTAVDGEQKDAPTDAPQVSENSVAANNELQSEPKEHALEPALPITPSSPAPIPTIVISKPSKISKAHTDPTSEAKVATRPSSTSRRFSLPALSFSRQAASPKPALSTAHEHAKKSSAASSFFKRSTRLSSSDKRAKKSALVVRSLIIGPAPAVTPKLTITSANARPKLNKLKTQLLEPKSANKVIAQLRALPIEDDTEGRAPRGPIHAVCLEHTDEDVQRLHFSFLSSTDESREQGQERDPASFFDVPLALDSVTDMFSRMNIVSLISAPGLGLGAPGDAEGLLAGALPTAETVLKGFEQITPQLMALGYATGRAVWVDHQGLYPPVDRMSVLTYWWGLELVLPPPSLKNLAKAKSVAGTVVNFLTALSLINDGVREILPFVRYIAQFIDFEFNTIQTQDKGMGVICASTWIMPAALVPRPWDFAPPPPPGTLPPPPPSSAVVAPKPDSEQSVPPPPAPSPSMSTSPVVSSEPHPVTPVTPAEPATIPIPPSLPTFADSIVGAYADSVTFQPVAPVAGALGGEGETWMDRRL
ncbi:hypothetical protein DXG01_007857 [Tephrocybe rancida]|nr:hypothetical protein DXG01_007857 [Tephrocybe rancida]